MSNENDPPYTMEDLTDLVKAIKFAYPEYGIRKVHREITEVASEQESSLEGVKLGEVKKIWKKVGLSDYNNSNSSSTGAVDANANANANANVKEDSIPNMPTANGANDIVKFYTVGDGSIQSLTQGYQNTAKAAAEAASQSESNKDTSSSSQWSHFFLNVPADRSGTKPHQALINFSDDRSSKTLDKTSNEVQEDYELVKIQVAASIPGYDSMPMLLYNSDRSIRTFLHPPSSTTTTTTTNDNDNDSEGEKDDGGYHAIHQLITTNGNVGALGTSGGTKGYFRCKIFKDKNVVSIDVSSLAPPPSW